MVGRRFPERAVTFGCVLLGLPPLVHLSIIKAEQNERMSAEMEMDAYQASDPERDVALSPPYQVIINKQRMSQALRTRRLESVPPLCPPLVVDAWLSG